MNYKIISLDLDGVLNSGKYLKEFDLEDSEKLKLDPVKINIIKNVCLKNPDVRLIINSSWNATMTLDDYKKEFLSYDPTFDVNLIIDTTSNKVDKSQALVDWINSNRVEHFLFVDDDLLFDPSHPYYEYQVKTSYYSGLLDFHEDVILELIEVKFQYKD